MESIPLVNSQAESDDDGKEGDGNVGRKADSDDGSDEEWRPSDTSDSSNDSDEGLGSRRKAQAQGGRNRDSNGANTSNAGGKKLQEKQSRGRISPLVGTPLVNSQAESGGKNGKSHGASDSNVGSKAKAKGATKQGLRPDPMHGFPDDDDDDDWCPSRTPSPFSVKLKNAHIYLGADPNAQPEPPRPKPTLPAGWSSVDFAKAVKEENREIVFPKRKPRCNEVCVPPFFKPRLDFELLKNFKAPASHYEEVTIDSIDQIKGTPELECFVHYLRETAEDNAPLALSGCKKVEVFTPGSAHNSYGGIRQRAYMILFDCRFALNILEAKYPEECLVNNATAKVRDRPRQKTKLQEATNTTLYGLRKVLRYALENSLTNFEELVFPFACIRIFFQHPRLAVEFRDFLLSIKMSGTSVCAVFKSIIRFMTYWTEQYNLLDGRLQDYMKKRYHVQEMGGLHERYSIPWPHTAGDSSIGSMLWNEVLRLLDEKDNS